MDGGTFRGGRGGYGGGRNNSSGGGGDRGYSPGGQGSGNHGGRGSSSGNQVFGDDGRGRGRGSGQNGGRGDSQDRGDGARGRGRGRERGRGNTQGNVPQGPPPPLAMMPSGAPTSTTIQQALRAVDTHALALANHGISITTPPTQATDTQAIRRVKLEHGLRLDFANVTGTNRLEVVTNHLRLQAPPMIYVYDVDMIRGYNTNGNPIMVHKFADKMKVMQRVGQIPALASNLATNHWCSDGSLIFATVDLFATPTPGQVYMPPRARQVMHQITQPFDYYNETGQQLRINRVTISFKCSINTSTSLARLFYDPAALAADREVPQLLSRALNGFLTQYARAMPQQNTFTGRQKGFENNETQNLDHGALQARKGFFLSARLGVEGLLVNINTVSSAFLNGNQTVHSFLSDQTYRSKSPQQLNGLLKGTMVRITFAQPGAQPVESTYRFVHEIGDNIGAQRCLNGHASVRDCFERHPTCGMRHVSSALPRITNRYCRAVRVAYNMMEPTTANQQEWYPAEFLEILPHQPFHSPLEAMQTRDMIGFARERPDDSYTRIMTRGLTMFGLNNVGQSNLIANMSSGQQMIQTPARRLHAPVVRYASGPAPVTAASWNLTNVHFAQTARKLDELPFINLSRLSDHEVKVEKLDQCVQPALKTHQLLGNPEPQFHGGAPQVTIRSEDDMRNMLRQMQGTSTSSPILIAIQSKDMDLYARIKGVAELELGLPTIFAQMGNRRFDDAPTASNIALKYNLKMTQASHFLGDGAFASIRQARNTTDTIVIGADVTHPGKGSSPGTPSIAAVVGSTDAEFMHFPGSMRLQRSRKEFIIELGDMVKERLLDWAKKNGRLPRRMLFYRDGVAETQYAKLRSFEIPQIQKAFNWAKEYLAWSGANRTPDRALDESRNPWPLVIPPPVPPAPQANDAEDEFPDDTGLNVHFELTYVVVGKRHNTRFYASSHLNRINGGNHNVVPGLLVDQVITHPYSFDFFLQSHQPIAGIGRSAHYFVLKNQMGLGADGLQQVTHDFCYTYAKATKGVSYCAPAYYADRLCDRGRGYIRGWLTQQEGYRRTKVNTETQIQFDDEVREWLRKQDYWRAYANTNPDDLKYGFTRRNPWHPNLDDTMFYL